MFATKNSTKRHVARSPARRTADGKWLNPARASSRRVGTGTISFFISGCLAAKVSFVAFLILFADGDPTPHSIESSAALSRRAQPHHLHRPTRLTNQESVSCNSCLYKL